MCGIFGAIGNSIKEEIMQEIAEEALKRGPQAHGIAWYSNENICLQVNSSAINPQKAFKGMSEDCRAIIGNCRLSTSGSYLDEQNNQPLVLDQTVISHNGNVKSYLQIAEELEVKLSTKCDSEIICHLINRFGVKEALSRLSAEVPMALLILHENKLTAFRQGQPLYTSCIDGTHYFCSRKFTGAKPIKEGKIIELKG